MELPSSSFWQLITDSSLILLGICLVLLNGFFVAAEFALVKIRATRTPELAKTYGLRGKILLKVHSKLDAYLSACQLGITLASLGLGWVGEPAFAHLITPVLSLIGITNLEAIHTLAFILAFGIISFLHIVVGELAPKTLAIRNPEKLALITATPLYIFYWFMYPAIYLLNASSNLTLRFLKQNNFKHEASYSTDELKLILHSGRAYQHDNEMQMIAKAIELTELEAVDWANSREDLIFLNTNMTNDEITQIFRRSKYSRYPVFNLETHQFIGILHIKDWLEQLLIDASNFNLTEHLHPLEFIERTMPLTELLEKFRGGDSHFALVVETDNKVIGYLTMEDVLEILVGDIQDEHKKNDRSILSYKPGKLLMRGDTPLFKLERLLHIDLEHIEAETLAGLVYEQLKRVPDEDEVIETNNLRIVIKKMRGPKIVLAKVIAL